MGETEADWGAIGLSPFVPFAFRNPQCCVQSLQGKVAGTLAPSCQWNGEMETGLSRIYALGQGLGRRGPRTQTLDPMAMGWV